MPRSRDPRRPDRREAEEIEKGDPGAESGGGVEGLVRGAGRPETLRDQRSKAKKYQGLLPFLGDLGVPPGHHLLNVQEKPAARAIPAYPRHSREEADPRDRSPKYTNKGANKRRQQANVRNKGKGKGFEYWRR